MTDTTMVIVPREANEDMMLAGMASADLMATATQGDAHIAAHAAMCDAAPNAGSVSEVQVEKMAASAYKNRTDFDFSSAPKHIRSDWISDMCAALAALGLAVGGE